MSPEARSLKRKRKRRRIREKIIELKTRPCSDCGTTYTGEFLGLMTFDHLPGTRKRFNIGEANTFKSLAEEVSKCRIICRYCHDAQEFLRNGRQIGKRKRILALASLLLLVEQEELAKNLTTGRIAA